MKNNFILLVIIPLLFSAADMCAQKFSLPLEGFSRSKITYLHMEGGTVHEGQLSGFKRSKGLIELIKMKNPTGKKLKIDPSKISFMYLPPSNLAKISTALDKGLNVNKWSKESTINSELIGEGYVYFEKTPTKIKKKTDDLMLQLLNPSFSNKIKVYHDPFAKETMSLGVAGVEVAGGLDKSYYIKKVGDNSAFRLFKKNYKEDFSKIFKDCAPFMEKYSAKIQWNDFEMHVFEYTQMVQQ